MARRVVGEFRLGFDQSDFGTLLKVRDLSPSGVCFHITKPVPYMTKVKLMLWLPDASKNGDQNEFPCSGVVVRSEPCNGSNGSDPSEYEVAVFFTEMPRPTLAAVEAYVAVHPEIAES